MGCNLKFLLWAMSSDWCGDTSKNPNWSFIHRCLSQIIIVPKTLKITKKKLIIYWTMIQFWDHVFFLRRRLLPLDFTLELWTRSPTFLSCGTMAFEPILFLCVVPFLFLFTIVKLSLCFVMSTRQGSNSFQFNAFSLSSSSSSFPLSYFTYNNKAPKPCNDDGFMHATNNEVQKVGKNWALMFVLPYLMSE